MNVALYVYVLCALVALARGDVVVCNKNTACEPWDLIQGPFCARGNNLNLRFGIDIAPENGYERYNQFNTQSTYAACVIVDELSAVNLTNAGKYIATVVKEVNTTTPVSTTPVSAEAETTPPTTAAPTIPAIGAQFTTQLNESWLSAFGFGGNDNIAFPNKETSTGTVMVFSNDTSICGDGMLPFVTFLILKISLLKGKFSYVAQNNQPTGVGFDSTCKEGECILDSSMKCIGAYGHLNCAQCYTADEIANLGIQVWLSYGGSDRSGKDLLSYSSNPLNFRRYAGSSAYNQVANSLSGVSSGEFSRRDPLSP